MIRHASRDPSYSLIEVKRSEKTTADHPVPYPYHVAFLDSEFDMGFAAMCTDQRSWIVGVGGFPGRVEDGPPLRQAETIVFDCKTEAIAKGPPPTSPKYLPLAFTVGTRVYLLTYIPCIWSVPNGPPWFEVLDLSDASCVDGRLTNCSWRTLTPPPLFPVMDEEELALLDQAPWTARIESYAVVGRYILLSPAAGGGPSGTVAFDVSEETWHFVDREKNLPFIGEAVPYGRLFLGRSRSKESKDLAAYDISVAKTGTERTLSIVEVPLTLVEDDSPVTYAQFFSCLGNGVLCATGCGTKSTSCRVEKEDEDVYIRLYRPVNVEEGEEETQRGGIVLCSKGSVYYFKLHEPYCQLVTPTLVAAPCIVI